MDETDKTINQSVEQNNVPSASVDMSNLSHEQNMRQKTVVTTLAALVIMVIMIFFYIYFVGYIRQDVPEIVIPQEKTPEEQLMYDLQQDEQVGELDAGDKKTLLNDLKVEERGQAELTPDEKEELFNNL